MPFDYLASFPIPSHLLPKKLCNLLTPVNLLPEQEVEVACMHEIDPDGDCPTHLQMLMAVVPGADGGPIGVLDESEVGVVRYSTSFDEYGCMADISPSISGYDYIVASWGSLSFFTFSLMDGVINSFRTLAEAIERLMQNK